MNKLTQQTSIMATSLFVMGQVFFSNTPLAYAEGDSVFEPPSMEAALPVTNAVNAQSATTAGSLGISCPDESYKLVQVEGEMLCVLDGTSEMFWRLEASNVVDTGEVKEINEVYQDVCIDPEKKGFGSGTQNTTALAKKALNDTLAKNGYSCATPIKEWRSSGISYRRYCYPDAGNGHRSVIMVCNNYPRTVPYQYTASCTAEKRYSCTKTRAVTNPIYEMIGTYRAETYFNGELTNTSNNVITASCGTSTDISELACDDVVSNPDWNIEAAF